MLIYLAGFLVVNSFVVAQAIHDGQAVIPLWCATAMGMIGMSLWRLLS